MLDLVKPKVKSDCKARMASRLQRTNMNIREYIDHVEKGIPLRVIAKRDGVHASTVMRRIRKIETKREDPLLDDALKRISKETPKNLANKEASMNLARNGNQTETQAKTNKDVIRILRRLSEKTAFMVMSLDLPKAVVMRGTGKMQVRSAVLSRELGQKLLLEDWVECTRTGKFTKYVISNAGRASLKRMVLEEGISNKNGGFSEAVSPFLEQHREWGTRSIQSRNIDKKKIIRVNLRESPLNMLGRKKNKDGKPFLTNELLQAGERLREDFELAQLGPRVTQNWDRFLLGSDCGNFGSNESGGSSAAQKRLSNALTALGPGLGDITLRCCCFLEGMEAAEKRMGWSARSGKIVLRIALQRLRMHYEEENNGMVEKIG